MTPRRAGPGDEGKLALVAAASFLESFADDHPGDAIVAHVADAHSAERYRALLADPNHALWLVEGPAGAPIGYAVLAPAGLPGARAGDVELKRIYLLSKWHGGGHGRALFVAVLTEAKARHAARLQLSVYTKNAKAIHFYAKLGFAKTGATVFPGFPPEFGDHVMTLQLA